MVTLPFKIGSGNMLATWVESQELEDGFSELVGLLTLAFRECGVPLISVLDVGVLGII